MQIWKPILGLVAGAAVILASAVPAAAERDYPFCKESAYGGRRCSFDTYEQCRASGPGGTCYGNPYLAGANAQQLPAPSGPAVSTGQRRRR
jgi:hypothetical protein